MLKESRKKVGITLLFDHMVVAMGDEKIPMEVKSDRSVQPGDPKDRKRKREKVNSRSCVLRASS